MDAGVSRYLDPSEDRVVRSPRDWVRRTRGQVLVEGRISVVRVREGEQGREEMVWVIW